ncbi:CD209 antigen-like protein C [Sphaeramia orbicularis]|uniref:CD209 antigen-like protein C n=1 Tax=Sphaeramia orbicularis TaxID=375764 RepID=UPI00117D70CE|nr:CD209 antigen-like protein C [Sphaeramia orbicularis]
MEDLYMNIEEVKHVNTGSSAPQVSNRGLRRAVVFLGFFCGSLMFGLIGLGVYINISAAELTSIKANMTDHLQTSKDQMSDLNGQLQTSRDQISDLIRDRDQLNTSLIRANQEVERLQTLPKKQKTTCPAGWRMSFCSCYFFSSTAGPWEAGRNDCKNRDADLVVIDSTEEQEFIQGFKDYYWIGLTDRVNEGTWKWVDGSPVTLTFWDKGEPNNGMGSNGVNLGEEDCAEKPAKGKWNDLSCNTLRRWICEK